METFSRWKVRIERDPLRLRFDRCSLKKGRKRKLRSHEFAQLVCRGRGEIVRDPILKTTEKRNGGCAGFRAQRKAGEGRGKKARNRLTMKLQCNDLTAVFHLARLYVAFCPSNHGMNPLLPFRKFISPERLFAR